MDLILALLGIAALIVVAVILAPIMGRRGSETEKKHRWCDVDTPARRAGKMGEEAVSGAIQQILRQGDWLFTNAEISFHGKEAELDNVIVNRYGVFIIEVKNYKGRLIGTEDDFEWDKYKDDGYGNTFLKKVKNPIKQVKRQIYILAKHLQDYGADVWVEGYALFVQNNSPIDSRYVLSDIADVDRAIHTYGKHTLTPWQIENVKHILTNDLDRGED